MHPSTAWRLAAAACGLGAAAVAAFALARAWQGAPAGLVAWLLAALVLAGVARALWTRPARRPRRVRERVLRAIAALARPDLQDRLHETEPFADIADLLLDDWHRAWREAGEPAAATAFAAAEWHELRTLAARLDEAARSLLPSPETPREPAALRRLAAFQAAQQAAAAALDRFVELAGRPDVGSASGSGSPIAR